MVEKKKGLFSRSRMVFFVLSVLVFYLVLHYLGKIEDTKALLLKMNQMWLLAAIGFQMGTYFSAGLIWRMVLLDERGKVSFFALFKMSIVVLFVNQMIPSGGISGDGYVFNQLVKRKVSSSTAFMALIVETISYYVAFLILLAVFYGLYLVNALSIKPVITYTVLLGFVFYSFLGALVLTVSNKHALSFLLHKLYRFGRIRHYLVQSNLISIPEGRQGNVKPFLKNKKNAFGLVFFQFCIIACDILTIFAIMKGFQLHLPFMNICLVALLSLVIGALPISPGSLIVYESAMTYFFTLLGAPLHAALLVTLLFRFFSFWLPIPIGLLLYRNLQRTGRHPSV